jgi:hypothetical protein
MKKYIKYLISPKKEEKIIFKGGFHIGDPE